MRINFTNHTIKNLKLEMKKAVTLNNLKLYRIVRALLMISEGYDKEEIAVLMNINIRTVYNWMSEFVPGGFAWLLRYRFKGRGCKSRLSEEQRKKLYNIVAEGPETYGFDIGVRTSAMTAEVIFSEFGVSYNPQYVCDLLKKTGLSYQKAEFESDHPDEEKRKEWIRITCPKILKEAEEKGAVILFGDEVSFARWGSLSRTWAPRGKQPLIKTTGIRKGLKMFGAIEFFRGSFHYRETEGKFNGESYISFLKDIMSVYSKPVILIEDGAKYHHSETVRKYKDEMKRKKKLFTYKLPSYSPDYNPIEKLWRNTKKEATHCKYFPTFDDLRKAVVKVFNKYMEDAAKVICVMKKMREEAGII